jgi:hypothetical protein
MELFLISLIAIGALVCTPMIWRLARCIQALWLTLYRYCRQYNNIFRILRLNIGSRNARYGFVFISSDIVTLFYAVAFALIELPLILSKSSPPQSIVKRTGQLSFLNILPTCISFSFSLLATLSGLELHTVQRVHRLFSIINVTILIGHVIALYLHHPEIQI